MKKPREANAREDSVAKINRLIGYELRKQRVRLGLTQSELGSAVGVTFQQIQKYENGTDRLSVSTLVLMSLNAGIDSIAIMVTAHEGRICA